MTPIAVVGDIHGEVLQLRAALRALDDDGRHVVFVGDYIDWGRDSAAVLDELIARRSRSEARYTFLVGNHELALLRYLGDAQLAAFAEVGGIPTIRSYLATAYGDVHAAFSSAFPPSHREFLERLEPYWESDELLISHAGFDPADPSLRTLEAMATGARGTPFSATRFPRDLVVCGHYVQSNGRPHVSEHLVCVDTGCGSNQGPLTVAWFPEGTFTQFEREI